MDQTHQTTNYLTVSLVKKVPLLITSVLVVLMINLPLIEKDKSETNFSNKKNFKKLIIKHSLINHINSKKNILNIKNKSIKSKITINNLLIIKSNKNLNNNLYKTNSMFNKNYNNNESKNNKNLNFNKNKSSFRITKLPSNSKSNKNNKNLILFPHSK